MADMNCCTGELLDLGGRQWRGIFLTPVAVCALASSGAAEYKLRERHIEIRKFAGKLAVSRIRSIACFCSRGGVI